MRPRVAFASVLAGCVALTAFVGACTSSSENSRTQPGAGSGGATGATGGQGGTPASGGSTPQGGTSAQGGSVSGGGTAGSGTGAEGGTAGSGGSAGVPNIPTGSLVLWLDATRGITDESGKVTRWADQSGSTFDATQTNAASQPKIGSDGGVLFDGIDDYLALPGITSVFANGISIFVVVSRDTGTTCSPILHMSTGPELDDISLQGEPNDSVNYEVYNSTAPSAQGALPSAKKRSLIRVTQSLNSAHVLVNSLPAGQNSAMEMPTIITRTQSFVGKGLYEACSTWPGEMYELLLYDREVNVNEIGAIESYLKAKWTCCQ